MNRSWIKLRQYQSGCVVLCILAELFPYTVSWSQELLSQRTTRGTDSLKVVSVSFDRLLNTFLWNGQLRDSIQNNDGGFRIDQTLHSRLIRTDQSSTQDEYEGRTVGFLNIADRWKIWTTVSSSVLTDSRSAELGSLAQHQLLGGLAYLPDERTRGVLLGGFELNTQLSEHDRGFAYSGAFDASNIKVQDIQTNVQTQWSQSLLGKRSPHDGGINVGMVREFQDKSNDSLYLRYDTQRREFYTTADSGLGRLYSITHNLFRRDAQEFKVGNRLRYSISPGAQLSIDAGIFNRSIDRGFRFKNYGDPSSIVLDARIQEFQIHGSMNLRWEIADSVRWDVGLLYSEREERHTIVDDPSVSVSATQPQASSARRLENVSRMTSFVSDWNAAVSEQDQFRLRSSANLLQYDTPDSLNTDDRDELLVTLSAEESHTFSSYCSVTLTADITLNHLVYISRFESANNNWNRVFRFSPAVTYTPVEWLRSVNRAEVLANYTVYDFEEQVSAVKSFAFRQASWTDSTIVQLSRRVEFELIGSVRLYERGILKWQEFKERPENYFVEKTLWPRVIVLFGRARMGVGYRFFSQDRYRYAGSERVFDQSFEIEGPTALLEWEGQGGQRLSLEGWRESQQFDSQSATTVSNLSMKLSLLL